MEDIFSQISCLSLCVGCKKSFLLAVIMNVMMELCLLLLIPIEHTVTLQARECMLTYGTEHTD